MPLRSTSTTSSSVRSRRSSIFRFLASEKMVPRTSTRALSCAFRAALRSAWRVSKRGMRGVGGGPLKSYRLARRLSSGFRRGHLTGDAGASARGPLHVPAAHDVDVQVEDRLPGIAPRVDDGAIPRL